MHLDRDDYNLLFKMVKRGDDLETILSVFKDSKDYDKDDLIAKIEKIEEDISTPY